MVFDTMIEHINADEIEAVLAHELGHFKHHDIPKGLAISLSVMFLGFAANALWHAWEGWAAEARG